MTNKNVTIHDIAKQLNIDSSTVSRALNESPRVKQITKDLIKKTASDLGYQQNKLASNLRSQRTKTIGVIIPRISRHFFSAAISGIEEVAYDAGYNIMICQSLELLEREVKNANTLFANRVDGLLISISMNTSSIDHLINGQSHKTPIVFFDRIPVEEGITAVKTNDYEAAFNATKHLVESGSKKIAYLSGPIRLSIYSERLNGYKAALKHFDLPIIKDFIMYSSLMSDDGIECSNKLLNLSNPPDALLCANDTSAVAALEQIKKLGISIPEDFAIVGFSNEPISAITDPKLSTVDQSGFDIGRKAIEVLLKKINKVDQIEKTTVIPSKLLIRESSQCVK